MRKSDLKKKDELQAVVRQVAAAYLDDPNITSVGIGYKVKDDVRTDTPVLQFTVGKKHAPEAIEASGTQLIPSEIIVNGRTYPTDVVERDFRPDPVTQPLETKSDRKKRLDPLVPGISIAHPSSTAGTLGCFVADLATGEPLILSNWHVLHGEEGELGDTIVQPGPYDDNRIAENGAGVLVRSFLGLAGDCALARPSGRALSDRMLELDVPVREIGDPELDDRVVKSGRTTDVTHGIVTRIHTISRLPYGSFEEDIGSFEIGPDPDHPAPNDEISMGGDSGSAWLESDAEGKATDMILGLHFGGETTEPNEYALACYASSVFEKLEIRPLQEQAPDADRRGHVDLFPTGFDTDFLPGHSIAAPEAVGRAIAQDYAATRSGGQVRHYTHFSLAMSASRRFARWVAWNIDGGSVKRISREGIDFVVDPEYDLAHQVDDDVYSPRRLDRGHIARRADLVWGSLEEAHRANVDSFYFTNITPQVDDFNQAARGGIWGRLEDAIFAEVDVDDLRVSVLGGPIFKDDDIAFKNVQLPRSFWKLITFVEGGTLQAKAFVLTQDDLESKIESLGLEEFKVYQLKIGDLSGTIGLNFGETLTAADTALAGPEAIGANGARRIRAVTEIT